MNAGRPEVIRFPVSGMTCGSCVARITRFLRKVDGVSGVRVDLRREAATVRRDPIVATDAAISGAVGQAGYSADLSVAVAGDEGDLTSLFGRLLSRITIAPNERR